MSGHKSLLNGRNVEDNDEPSDDFLPDGADETALVLSLITPTQSENTNVFFAEGVSEAEWNPHTHALPSLTDQAVQDDGISSNFASAVSVNSWNHFSSYDCGVPGCDLCLDNVTPAPPVAAASIHHLMEETDTGNGDGNTTYQVPQLLHRPQPPGRLKDDEAEEYLPIDTNVPLTPEEPRALAAALVTPSSYTSILCLNDNAVHHLLRVPSALTLPSLDEDWSSSSNNEPFWLPPPKKKSRHDISSFMDCISIDPSVLDEDFASLFVPTPSPPHHYEAPVQEAPHFMTPTIPQHFNEAPLSMTPPQPFNEALAQEEAEGNTTDQGLNVVYIIPRKMDVLSGRGGLTNKHPGNKLFHKEKEQLQQLYWQARTHKAKQAIAKQLVDTMKRSYGSRFLAQDEGSEQWSLVHDSWALEKAKQALRTKLTPEEEQQKRRRHAAKKKRLKELSRLG